MSLKVKMSADKAGGTAPDGSTVAGQKQEAELWVQRDSVHHVVRDGLETVIDFSRRRILEIDRRAGTYVDSSLHADIALRHFESPNRQHIWSVLQAGGADAAGAAGFSPIMTEHQLSMLGATPATTIADLPDAQVKGLGGLLRSMFARTPRSDISIELRDGDVVFTSPSGRVLVSYAREGFEAGPDLMHRLALFLRLTYGGHPLILERLAAAGRVPREIRFAGLVPVGGPGDEITLRVEATELAPDRPFLLDGHRRVLSPAEADGADAALERALLGEAVDPTAVCSQRMREAQEAKDAGRSFEALLTIIELSLETDIPVQELGEAVRRIADPRAAQLLSACSRGKAGPEESKAALALIDGLREEAGCRAHVLQTFAASCHKTVGQAAEARERLLSALAINPLLAGAYKDLGDLYLGEYSARKAWTCWEAARRIAPGHSMLSDVLELEKSLEGAHPEYFPRQG